MKKIAMILSVLLLAISGYAQTANDDLIKAVLAGDLITVKKLVDGGADVNYKSVSGATPLSSAYFQNEITEYLLSKNADPNGGDSPALVSASRFYSLEVMKMLLKAGADPNKPAVVKVDMAGPIKKLLEDEQAKGKKANKYTIKAYEDMLKKMGPANTVTTYALQAAVENTNCAECIELLITSGARVDVNNPIIEGNLIHAVAFSYVSPDVRAASIQAMGPALEKYGIAVPDWYKNLDPASMGTAEEIIGILKSKGVDIEGLDNNKRTPLKIAVTAPVPSEEIIMALVHNGANIKATGMTLVDTEFEKETSNPEKIKVKFDFPGEGRNAKNGSGYSANMDLVNPKPKRVALISYYLYDAGKGKANITGTAAWCTKEYVGQTQVNGFYQKSIGKLKDAFKENGISLLTPDEFLDSEEKAEYFFGFNQESAKKEKTTLTRSKTRSSSNTNYYSGWTTTTTTTTTSTAGTLKVCPALMGYRPFFVANEAEDESQISNFQGGVFTANRKLTSSLGYELAKGLGVDAVVVVYIGTRKPKQLQEDYAVNTVVMMMFGPNPGRTETSDPEAKNLGQFYCGTRTFYSSPLIFKDNKGVFGQYDGMANVLAAHAAKMCKYINGSEKDSGD